MTAQQSIPTVMTIDDDKFDQLLYRRIIQRSGLVGKLISFRMAEDALDYLKSQQDAPVDVIFLDINMPRMTGFEFLEAAQKEFGEAFAKSIVVMLTTSLDERDVARVRDFTVVKDFLQKPLKVEHLEDIAHRFCA